ERAELDRVRRAGLRAGRLQPVVQPVVTHRALPRPAVALAPLDHAVRARRNAVAATVADVLLHYDCRELGAEQRPRRADVETARVRAVLANVRAHQPPEVGPLADHVGDRLLELRHAQVD